MKRLVIAFVAVVDVAFVGVRAQAADGGCPPVAYAPAPAGVVAQGQPGYRTYSYQPSTGYRTYSYQPGPSYRYTPSMRGRTGTGFADATRKALGNY